MTSPTSSRPVPRIAIVSAVVLLVVLLLAGALSLIASAGGPDVVPVAEAATESTAQELNTAVDGANVTTTTEKAPLSGTSVGLQNNDLPVGEPAENWNDVLAYGKKHKSYRDCFTDRTKIPWVMVKKYAALENRKPSVDMRFILASNTKATSDEIRAELAKQGYTDLNIPIRDVEGFSNTAGLETDACKEFQDGRSQARVMLAVPYMTGEYKGNKAFTPIDENTNIAKLTKEQLQNIKFNRNKGVLAGCMNPVDLSADKATPRKVKVSRTSSSAKTSTTSKSATSTTSATATTSTTTATPSTTTSTTTPATSTTTTTTTVPTTTTTVPTTETTVPTTETTVPTTETTDPTTETTTTETTTTVPLAKPNQDESCEQAGTGNNCGPNHAIHPKGDNAASGIDVGGTTSAPLTVPPPAGSATIAPPGASSASSPSVTDTAVSGGHATGELIKPELG